nr:immunoglobulin heavy chain junction region [Macaca mulatta]MOW75730.1 immunoglobulin heavy chain junction region [Macaca mulatta]MOW77381.1 immunoglobulin heavy chain junction region [Macaca mulatta]MOW80356.1 immunoglobulin heavy chain junction region [Macaca mulatta]MOW81346.1 immunoglobulin heavy chain junction region [Macaca mulatta]
CARTIFGAIAAYWYFDIW